MVMEFGRLGLMAYHAENGRRITTRTGERHDMRQMKWD
jgi:hypothetical protein